MTDSSTSNLTAKPKILATTSSFPCSPENKKGGGQFLFELYKRLSKEFELTVLAPFIKGSESRSDMGGFEVIRYSSPGANTTNFINKVGIVEALRKNILYFFLVPFFMLSQLLAIRKEVSQKGINIIHANWTIPQGLVAILYKKIFNNNIKVIVTSHGSDLNMKFGSIGTILNKYVVRNSDILTVVSNPLKEKAHLLGYKGYPDVIPMGLDTNHFKPMKKNTIKEKLKINGKMILFVGYFTEVKGIEYLIRAMPDILDKHKEVTLVMVGDGNLKEEMEDLSRKLGVDHKTIFTGFISPSNLPAYYSDADITIMPSLSEGSPVVLPEALCCGTIVITSDLPVYLEHITDGENGFIVKRGSSKEISDKAIQILNNFDQYTRMKGVNRDKMVRQFDWVVISEKFSNIISNL